MSKNVIVKQAPPRVGSMHMGLEKYNLTSFEGADSTYPIPIKQGKLQHGLEGEQKKFVESAYGYEFDNPDHFDFWTGLIFTTKHTLNAYDPVNSAQDLLALSCMKTLGTAAKSMEEFKDKPMANFQFVVSDEEQELEDAASIYEKTDAAIIELGTLKKSKKYLIAVASYVLPKKAGINKNADRAYLKLREYVEGKNTRTKIEAINNFLNALTIEKEVLYTTVDFRNAYNANIIRKNARKVFYNPKTEVEYGKTETEALAFLLDPKNQSEIGTGSKTDEPYSIRYQLKQLTY